MTSLKWCPRAILLQPSSRAKRYRPPAHPGAQVAGVFFGVIGHVEDVGFKKADRDAQKVRVFFYLPAVFRAVARIHDHVFAFEGHLGHPEQHLEELGHQHGILAAGDADADPVMGCDQAVFFDGGHKGRPQFLPVFFDDRALDRFAPVQFPRHGQPPYSGSPRSAVRSRTTREARIYPAAGGTKETLAGTCFPFGAASPSSSRGTRGVSAE